MKRQNVKRYVNSLITAKKMLMSYTEMPNKIMQN